MRDTFEPGEDSIGGPLNHGDPSLRTGYFRHGIWIDAPDVRMDEWTAAQGAALQEIRDRVTSIALKIADTMHDHDDKLEMLKEHIQQVEDHLGFLHVGNDPEVADAPVPTAVTLRWSPADGCPVAFDANDEPMEWTEEFGDLFFAGCDLVGVDKAEMFTFELARVEDVGVEVPEGMVMNYMLKLHPSDVSDDDEQRIAAMVARRGWTERGAERLLEAIRNLTAEERAEAAFYEKLEGGGIDHPASNIPEQVRILTDKYIPDGEMRIINEEAMRNLFAPYRTYSEHASSLYLDRSLYQNVSESQVVTHTGVGPYPGPTRLVIPDGESPGEVYRDHVMHVLQHFHGEYSEFHLQQMVDAIIKPVAAIAVDPATVGC